MKLPDPSLQIEFATLLEGARTLVLRDALRETVRGLSVAEMDAQLSAAVPADALSLLAGQGLRGESVFPIPAVLTAKPSLLGYYRLLYGYSQKQFYTSATGCAAFKSMEVQGVLRFPLIDRLPELCEAFARAGTVLLRGVESHLDRPDLFHELSLLTLGSQYRGGSNNQRGAAGIKTVFEVIRAIVEDGVISAGESVIEVRNAAKTRVTIKVAADPDIFLVSHLPSGGMRPILAIEVKAGEDQSNIHNRVGEAEKSHQKARAAGVTECWTIINVPQADLAKLKQESPSTDRFFQMLDITDTDSDPHATFREVVRDLLGLG